MIFSPSNFFKIISLNPKKLMLPIFALISILNVELFFKIGNLFVTKSSACIIIVKEGFVKVELGEGGNDFSDKGFFAILGRFFSVLNPLANMADAPSPCNL